MGDLQNRVSQNHLKNFRKIVFSKKIFFLLELIKTKLISLGSFFHTPRKIFLSEKIQVLSEKTWKNDAIFRIFSNFDPKFFFEKKRHFFKSARKQLHCVLWCYITHADDYPDWLRPLYYRIGVVLYFAVFERLKIRHFFQKWQQKKEKRISKKGLSKTI